MTSARTDPSTHRQDVALFRYTVIAPLLPLDPASPQLAQTLRQQAARSWSIPGSTRTRVAVNTMRDWIRIYRIHGFDGLLPKPRTDVSKPRRMDVETIETLLAIKRGHLELSVRKVIEKVRGSGAVAADAPLPPTTVHRLFTSEGMMDMTGTVPVQRRRFSYAWAGELWMSDVMHGPRVRDQGGRARKTYLINMLDDATRLVPYSAFCFSEATPDFLQVLRQAILRRGLPVRLYVDHGASYRSRQTALVCAKLGIALIHARPRSPAGRARSSGGCATDVPAAARTAGTETRSRSSRRTPTHAAWRRCARGCAQPPVPTCSVPGSARAHLGPLPEPMPEPFDIAVTRRVGADCTVAFEGRTYSVPFALVGQRVEVRGCARHVQILAGADIVAAHPRATAHRIVLDPGHFQGESTETVIAPAPLGRMGTRIAEIAALAPESRPLDLYAALAEVAR